MTDEALLFNYNIPLLRNFEVTYLTPLLRGFIPEISQLTSEIVGETNSWAKFNQVLNKLLREGFDDTELEEILFVDLSYNSSDHSYIFNMETDIGIDEFHDRHTHLNESNRKLTDIRNGESNLISIRRIGNDVIFLYRFGIVNAESDKPVSIYVPCIFDFTNNLLHIKMKINYINKSQHTAIDIINQIRDKIAAENDLDITISAYNPSVLRKVLYNVFSKEAENAENIIKSKITSITDEDLNLVVKSFLTDKLEIEASSSYIDRVKSTFYQSKSLDMNNEEFYSGFIFAFSFLDGAMTRSLTRSSDREPVFNKKIYWNLKDIIHEEKEITELSLYWKFDVNDFDNLPEGNEFSFVEVSLREKKGMLEIHFYKCNGDRRKKNEYVIHRIIKYLREEGLSQ